MTPKFHTARGRLTEYALACGYIETKTVHRMLYGLRDRGIHVTLEMPSPGARAYHVRAYDFDNHVRVVWRTEFSLGKARAFFDQRHVFWRELAEKVVANMPELEP